MMYDEFKKLTGCNIMYEVFKQFESQYMICEMTKDAFCKTVRPIVKQIERAEREKTSRKFYRETINRCVNGNVVYRLYVLIDLDIASGKTVAQYTGFCGCGEPDRYMNIKVKAGVATLTAAEKEKLRLMDVWWENPAA